MSNVIKGRLRQAGSTFFLESPEGEPRLTDARIWSGYGIHWLERAVCGRYLAERDYDGGEPIALLYPDRPAASTPYVELYYNERLVKYPASTFGHNAINVNGEVFNFSHVLYENEITTPEEYFFRPALGPFAPSPDTGRFELKADGREYYDRFGRNFMRTIHVARFEGMETESLAVIYREEIARIRNTPPDPRRPHKYRDFAPLTRSCTTIVRDGLRAYGLDGIGGIVPRDLFVSVGYCLLEMQRQGRLTVRFLRMPQLKVPEAPYSAPTPLLNPLNRWRVRRLPEEQTHELFTQRDAAEDSI